VQDEFTRDVLDSGGMSLMNPRSPDHDVEAAVARVLQAEQQARSAIEAARAEAAHIAEQARASARAWAERARARMARGQSAVERQLQAELAAIEAEACALPEHDEPEAAEIERLEVALQALAAALTGGPAEAR
jgi:hypothetical protein